MSSNEANSSDDLTLQSVQESHSRQAWPALYSFSFGQLPAGSINQTPMSRRKASKAAIEAMPKVTVAYEDGNECSICLNGFKVGDEVKEMPCKHSFHGACIEKWMGMSTLCPLCRFSLPAESEDEQNSDNNNYHIEYNIIYNIEFGSEDEEDTGGEWDTSSVDDDI
ncbi:PREDICTED: E3 ubiquitin-protein ligase RNF181-like [Fragaria vesca subsp. vesca]|uniref:E3 ubiquitin-protein ligase RNF181-like n=1 Tax=Fragaria vesca subsp. vesca TaxID=101020 RepID=UPI0002C3268A|nr:PREDICTED: E3 ubiquitin-protein ligase RNF181-like [Fragaria vesca subsp. vesca]